MIFRVVLSKQHYFGTGSYINTVIFYRYVNRYGMLLNQFLIFLGLAPLPLMTHRGELCGKNLLPFGVQKQ